ncbi:MAG: hypothetical protein QXI32_01345 [Candidatus Bathyarchaeia archaeon]
MSWYGAHLFLNKYIHNIGVLSEENAKTMVEVAIQNSPPEMEYYGFDFLTITCISRWSESWRR